MQLFQNSNPLVASEINSYLMNVYQTLSLENVAEFFLFNCHDLFNQYKILQIQNH